MLSKQLEQIYTSLYACRKNNPLRSPSLMLMLIGEYLLGVCMLAFCLPLIPNREGEWPATAAVIMRAVAGPE